jgi:hypothetical protein
MAEERADVRRRIVAAGAQLVELSTARPRVKPLLEWARARARLR